MGKNNQTVLKKVNDQLVDLSAPEPPGARVESLSIHAPEVFHALNHSGAHLLAQAVTELFDDVQYGIGPAVEKGFYYDFLTPRPFTPEDLGQIKKRMKHIVKQNIRIERQIWSRDEAIRYFQEQRQDLKVELIREKVESDTLSVYRQAGFVDLCKGPHVPSTGYLKNFDIMSVAASYWKGDEASHSMQRIYGIVFPTAEGLTEHMRILKEAQKRDHRKLGTQLDLFSIQEDIGSGLVIWHPKGSIIRHEIEKFWKERHIRNGYDFIYSPHIAKHDLWKQSGHAEFYSDFMYNPIDLDNLEYQLKPMNCPFHIMAYKTGNRSYRDLPLRWAELGTVYRYERSGVLHGLLRVRGFTQDDAHIFCTPQQLEEEIQALLDFSVSLLEVFGFSSFEIFVSTRPEKYVGEIDDWELATRSLVNALENRELEYRMDEGEGVFYGPKIDIKIRDSIKRSWQLTTIQIDFNLPRRFGLKYIDPSGDCRQPIMIHRALLGSIERFIGILIENYAGFFPLWLAPVQTIVLPIADRNMTYAEKVNRRLREHLIRTRLDVRSEGLGKKIRDAEIEKIPYIIIIGDEEEKKQSISYRIHQQGDRGSVDIDQFITGVKSLIKNKDLKYEL